MKKIYLVLLCIASTASLSEAKVNVVQTESRTYMNAPGGSYLDSCKNIETTVEGNGLDLYRIVKAECRRANGQWQKSSIRIPLTSSSQYDVTLKNNDGKLEVDSW